MTSSLVIPKSTTEHLGATQLLRPPTSAKRHGFSPPFTAEHIAEHFLTFEDVEAVMTAPVARLFSRSSNRPMWLGFNVRGEETYVVFEWIDRDTVYPITAFRRVKTP